MYGNGDGVMLDTVNGRQTLGAHGLWFSRPTRPRRGRKIAGVAIAIARRYEIDPIVVRVAFAVAAFYGGAGIVAYLLGWLLLATEEDEGSPFESMISGCRSSTSIPVTVVLCAALFPAMALVFQGAFGTFGLLMLAAALFLLHRGRGHLAPPSRPEPAPKVATEAPAGSTAGPGAEFGSWHRVAEREPATETATGAGTPRETPPAWDPLGAAPFAWDLPEPSKPEPEKRHEPEPRRRSSAGMITLGAALVVGAGCVLAEPYVSWLTQGHIIGVLLGVLGIGMVAGSFSGGGRGLILLTVPLSAAGVLFAPTPRGDRLEGIAEIDEYPRSIQEVQSMYNHTEGGFHLDLTALPEAGTVPPIYTYVGTGEIMIRLPQTADVELSCSAGTGSVECLNWTRSGMDSHIAFTDYGADGPGGLRIKLDVRTDRGRVEVNRG